MVGNRENNAISFQLLRRERRRPGSECERFQLNPRRQSLRIETIMNLDDTQRRAVADWIAGGQKLSEIQKRLADELNVHMTYMEVRLLVDDLRLTPKDVEPSKPVELSGKRAAAGTPAAAEELEADEEDREVPPGTDLAAPGAGGVSVKVDQVTRPGALVSGNVTFSDGNSAVWYLDQLGRLGLAPKQQGYKPSPADLQPFQTEPQAQRA